MGFFVRFGDVRGADVTDDKAWVEGCEGERGCMRDVEDRIRSRTTDATLP